MPKSKKPRKKHTPYTAKVNPLIAHGHCSAEVRYGDWGPHKAELYCLTHQKHIQWLSPEMAPKWAEALATAPGISSTW